MQGGGGCLGGILGAESPRLGKWMNVEPELAEGQAGQSSAPHGGMYPHGTEWDKGTGHISHPTLVGSSFLPNQASGCVLPPF